MASGFLPKAGRIQVVLSRLEEAAPADCHDAAKELLDRTINEVEDEFSGVPFDRSSPKDKGRMYPPLDDSRRSIEGRDDLVRYRSRSHNTIIGANGAIKIVSVPEKKSDGEIVVLDKPGIDGRTID